MDKEKTVEMDYESPKRWEKPYNSPLECGIRLLILLTDSYPKSVDVQRLLQYDYLLVHSGDVENGPKSLHPKTPLRSSELLVRRALVTQGLDLMLTRNLVDVEYTMKGIYYRAAELAPSFLDRFVSEYIKELRGISSWVVKHFSTYTNKELYDFMRNNWDRWGTEFSREYSFNEGAVE